MLLRSLTSQARSLALPKVGKRSEARIAMIAITTRSSISVKARRGVIAGREWVDDFIKIGHSHWPTQFVPGYGKRRITFGVKKIVFLFTTTNPAVRALCLFGRLSSEWGSTESHPPVLIEFYA